MPRPRARSIFLEQLQEAFMGSNSLPGWAVLAMLAAFTALSVALARGGSMLWLLVFVIALGFSIALFLKAKPLEI
jgi:hypothetical protein